MKMQIIGIFAVFLVIPLIEVGFCEKVCFDDGMCIPKCCPMDEIFNTTSISCQAKVRSLGEKEPGKPGGGKFTMCPGGEWLDDVKDKPAVLFSHYKCADYVTNGFSLVKKALICENQSKYNYVERIPITKCCRGMRFIYDVWKQECVDASEKNDSISWRPEVHSLSTNMIINVSKEDFHIKHEMIQCKIGYISQYSINFTFYEDGTLTVLDSFVKFPPNEFCLQSSLAPSSFVALFCTPDPCSTSVCVKKCCPPGYLMNYETKNCEPTTTEFIVDFRNEKGEQVIVAPNSFVLKAGMKPNCSSSGFNLLDPEQYAQDEFYILPNGNIFVPAYPEYYREVSDYCVEDFKRVGIERKSLICFGEESDTSPEEKLVLAIFPYFMFISSFFLIATFVVYGIIPEIRNIHGVTIMCHVASLATTYICLGIIQLDPTLPKPACVGLAIVVHFSFLASFMWLNVMSFDIWVTLSDLRPSSRQSRHRIGRRFITYSFYAWGVPAFIVCIGQILDNIPDLPINVLRPEFGVSKCWFSDKNTILAYLYGPVAIILLSNIVFFILTAIRLHRARMDIAFATKTKQNKRNYIVIFSLFVLMGVTWVTEVITANIQGGIYYSIPTDILNILTGVFIFIIFVCKRKVRRLLRLKMKPIEKIIRNKQRDTTYSSTATKSQKMDYKRKKSTLTNTSNLVISSGESSAVNDPTTF